MWVHNNYMSFFDGNVELYKRFFKELKIVDKNIFNAYFPEYNKKTVFCNNLIDYKTIINKSNEAITDFKKEDVPTFINIGRHDEKQKKISRIINSTRKLNLQGYKFNVIIIGKGSSTKLLSVRGVAQNNMRKCAKT